MYVTVALNILVVPSVFSYFANWAQILRSLHTQSNSKAITTVVGSYIQEHILH